MVHFCMRHGRRGGEIAELALPVLFCLIFTPLISLTYGKPIRNSFKCKTSQHEQPINALIVGSVLTWLAV